MKTENRVVWTEGMFLRVQHFQQADRWADRLIRDLTRQLSPFPWGFGQLAIDKSALGIGRLALTTFTAILPDGTPVSAPDQADLPAPLQLKEGVSDKLVYLCLPMRRADRAEFAGSGGEGSVTARMAPSEYEAADANADSALTAPIAVGRLAPVLKLQGEEMAGFEALPVARVVEVRADLSVQLDEDMIAPALNLAQSPRLIGFVTEILGLVRHRAAAIARRAGDPSVRGTAEIGDYFMLQLLNRATPILSHLAAQAGQMHPECAWRDLAALAGEFATFTAGDRLPVELPDYNHMEPAACFAPLMDELRRSLSAVLDQSAIAIPLEERRHGVRVGMLADAELRAGAGLVLAVRAEIPNEQLRRQLPNQIKIGSVERIAELVNVALPGLGIRPMPVAPRQLPFRSGTVYFELDNSGEIWRDITQSGTIAVHLSTDFPGLEIEMWGIRS
ncbi:type VI secretion system baseplate subunit TssK [Paracoccus sp. (in: a-proteobacteria)]|uniref:type VI secretion system baseplate subunit TssK n=1 Tax=Paracoccus sp. TaxID=267 RepID=UPI003A8C0082